MPIRICATPRCNQPATYRGRCAQHAQITSRNTHHNKAIYNTARWRYARRAALLAHPLCDCGQLAIDVHHRVDLADGGDPYHPANLEPLCKTCHGRITRTSQGQN